MELERMSDFFAKRIDTYDKHMINNVEGCKNGYIKLAELIPDTARKLLDLGCGTGLELGRIFQRFPDISVTGVDLSSEMLKKLREKYPDRDIILIEGSYIGRDFGFRQYDTAISFETMHHMTHGEKVSVYEAVWNALTPKGLYIECDYIVLTQAEEDALYAKNARLRAKQNIPDGEFYHFDTPCTVENQLMLLREAGFQRVDNVWREGSTNIIVAEK